MSTVFTKIINGEIPSFKVAENEDFYAFLDINPIAKGHTLVVPKQETDYIFDLENKTLEGLIRFAKPIAHAIDHALGTIRTGIIVEGLEVPHAHLHLIPIYSENQIVALGQHKEEFTKEEMAKIAEKIVEAL
jgi:histidine triad (HIT) family protein